MCGPVRWRHERCLSLRRPPGVPKVLEFFGLGEYVELRAEQTVEFMNMRSVEKLHAKNSSVKASQERPPLTQDMNANSPNDFSFVAQ